jgi:hypothetical protein
MQSLDTRSMRCPSHKESTTMSDEKSNTPPYPVGFKKPPNHTRFQKGHSGNPAGRPKGSPNFAAALEAALSERVIVNEGGQRYPVSKLVATVKQLVNKATQGDARATQQLLNMLPVLDSEPDHSMPPTISITETDQRVMHNILARIRQTTEGGPDDPIHT